MVDIERRVFKKGQIIYKADSFEPNMFNILYGRVAVYMDYKTKEEQKTLELGEGDFLNVISFLETRPRHTTVVALEKTEVGVITHENFGKFFQDQPAKVMSLLQHMSGANLLKIEIDAVYAQVQGCFYHLSDQLFSSGRRGKDFRIVNILSRLILIIEVIPGRPDHQSALMCLLHVGSLSKAAESSFIVV